MTSLVRWMPVGLLGLGALLTVGIDTQRNMPLRSPLESAIPTELAGYAGRPVTLSPGELEVAGASEYLMRNYESAAAPDTDWFSVYVGYYERQTQGKTIHSPKNCLPGGGWEPLASRTEEFETGIGRVKVNRYLLQRGTEQALVLYWYQGRGRVESNEYLVKWDLLRDAVMRQRTEEALVRVVVPIRESEHAAFALALRAAAVLLPSLVNALPGT